MEKALWLQWSITPLFLAPMEKARFYEKLFFELVIGMVKDKKKYSIKDKMSIKISFMDNMKWTRVMLPVVFEEFKVVYIFFCYFFLFTIIANCKNLIKVFNKILEGCSPPNSPVSTGLSLLLHFVLTCQTFLSMHCWYCVTDNCKM